MIRVGPDCHDLIDAHAIAAHSKVFRRPYGGAIAIAGGSQPTAHVPNVPGHVIGCHGRGGRLGKRIDNGVFDESRESIRNTQGVHREDQIIGAGLIGWGSLDNLWAVPWCARCEHDENPPDKESLKTHPIIIILEWEEAFVHFSVGLDPRRASPQSLVKVITRAIS